MAETGEFFSDWHRERYLEDLERERAGHERRLSELEALGQGAGTPGYDQAQAGVEAVTAELARLGHGQKTSSKRPRILGGAAETRA